MEEFINNILFKTDKNKNIKFCYNYGNPEEIIRYHLDYDYFIKKNYDDLIDKKYYKDDILDDYFISRLNDFNHDEEDVNFFCKSAALNYFKLLSKIIPENTKIKKINNLYLNILKEYIKDEKILEQINKNIKKLLNIRLFYEYNKKEIKFFEKKEKEIINTLQNYCNLRLLIIKYDECYNECLNNIKEKYIYNNKSNELYNDLLNDKVFCYNIYNNFNYKFKIDEKKIKILKKDLLNFIKIYFNKNINNDIFIKKFEELLFNYVKIIIIETFNVIKDNIFNKLNYIITNIKLIKEIININNDLIVLDLTENNLLNYDIDIDNLELNIKFISNILNKFNNLYKIYEDDKNKSIETMEKIKDIYDMLNDYEFTFDIENDFYNKLEEYNKKEYNFKKINYISNKVRKIENNNNCYYFNYYNDNNSDIDEYNSESDNDEENKND